MVDPVIKERRRWQRHEPDLPGAVTICWLDQKKGFKTVQVRVADISQGGLGIISSVALAVGARPSTGGTLDQFPVDLCGRGATVAGCTRLATDRYRIGLAFEQVPRPESRDERGIWHTGRDGQTISVNGSMCRMLEIDSPDDLLGKAYESFLKRAHRSSKADRTRDLGRRGRTDRPSWFKKERPRPRRAAVQRRGRPEVLPPNLHRRGRDTTAGRRGQAR